MKCNNDFAKKVSHLFWQRVRVSAGYGFPEREQPKVAEFQKYVLACENIRPLAKKEKME